MTKKTFTPEQLITTLRQIEVAVAHGKTTPQACKEADISEQSYHRWRKEYGGLKLEQAKRLKELERENAKLKRALAELALEKRDSCAGSNRVRKRDLSCRASRGPAHAGTYHVICQTTCMISRPWLNLPPIDESLRSPAGWGSGLV